jgi:hypothetical protein
MSQEQQFVSVWDAIEDTPAAAENMKLRSTLMMTLKNHIVSAGLLLTALQKGPKEGLEEMVHNIRADVTRHANGEG